MKNKFRFILALVAFSLIISHFITLDYSNLQWNNNSGYYHGIISMTLLIFAMIYEIMSSNNQEPPSEK
jgi:DMSO/TMAO reductase YedYZ heme-binding membrane subunit